LDRDGSGVVPARPHAARRARGHRTFRGPQIQRGRFPVLAALAAAAVAHQWRKTRANGGLGAANVRAVFDRMDKKAQPIFLHELDRDGRIPSATALRMTAGPGLDGRPAAVHAKLSQTMEEQVGQRNSLLTSQDIVDE
jgi:hypothetical protein